MKYLPLFRLGETCSHIGVLLFKIEACLRLGLQQSCTDVAATWNNSYRKDVCHFSDSYFVLFSDMNTLEILQFFSFHICFFEIAFK